MTADFPLLATLFGQFALIGLLAWGGGQSVLPLMEQTSVSRFHWLSPGAFASGVGFGYLVPGPVMTVSTFIGYQAAGWPGALAATLGVFLPTTTLAALAARGVESLGANRWVRAFGAGAAPAVIGLLAATAWNLARQSVATWPLAAVALLSLTLAARTKVSPVWLLGGGALLGWGAGRWF